MCILYGLQAPDEGEILLRGEAVRFRSALDAIADGMGMVHQAFKLFNSLTVWENVVYGREPRARGFIDRRAARRQVARARPTAITSRSIRTRSSAGFRSACASASRS